MSISSSSPSLKRRKMMSSSSRSPVSISSSRSLLKSPERNPRFGGDPPGPLGAAADRPLRLGEAPARGEAAEGAPAPAAGRPAR